MVTASDLLDAARASPPQPLDYSVHSTSGVYASFTPDNIRTDNPHSDTSRWTAPPPDHRRSSASSSSVAGSKRRRDPEWILLELDHVSLVTTIGFGKTTKPHPCNLADFTLWGGLTPDPLAMEPLLDSSLKNDSTPERFPLPISLPLGAGAGGGAAAPLPIRFLKIDCHLAANAAYSISIWHVFLLGHAASSSSPLSPSPCAPLRDPTAAAVLQEAYGRHRERETTRLVLAHLRRAGPRTLSAYRALRDALDPGRQEGGGGGGGGEGAEGTALEHPLLGALHDALVLGGDFVRAEALLDEVRRVGLLDEHCPGGGKGASVARWTRVGGAGGAGGPSGRGGHAMVRVGRKVLLFGGWDGTRDLGDLWEWDLDGGGWRCVHGGEGEGAGTTRPEATSCHQMAVDEREGWVYLLGGRKDELDDDDDDDEADDADASNAGENGSGPTAAAADMDLDPDHPTTSTSTTPALNRALTRLQRRSRRFASPLWRLRAVGPSRGTWELLSADTRRDGGPALLFDHAMVVQASAGRVFVFGGKNQPYEAEGPGAGAGGVGGGGAGAATDDPGLETGNGVREGRYSGMWCYDIETRRWSHLFGDPRTTSFAPRPASPSTSDRLLSRAGHALVLDESSGDGHDPTLYVLHGQRNEQYLADEWAIRLASPEGAARSTAGTASGGGGGGGAAEEAQLWRQGAVLDLPPPGGPSTAGSLVDPSAFPAAAASPSRPAGAGAGAPSTRQPTIVQIRRLPAPATAGPERPAPPAGFTQRLTLGPPGTWTLLTGLGAAPTSSTPPYSSSVSASASVGALGERDRERERARARERERGEGEERCVRGVWRRAGVGAGAGGDKGWERIEEEEGGMGAESPRGRYAAQVIYDPLKGEHYLFGGCPEAPAPGEGPDTRLGDFWKLKIVDPTPDEALRKAKFLVRKQRFAELCATAPTVLALQYLQNDLSLVVDHSSPTESAAFRACMAQLLAAPSSMNLDADAALSSASRPPTPTAGEDGSSVDEGTYRERHVLWEELARFVPRGMRQPDERLEDAARLLRVWDMGGWGALGA